MRGAKVFSFDMSLYRPPSGITEEYEIEIHVKAKHTPGWRYPDGYYDKSLGGYLPGDPPESEILEVTRDGKDFWPYLIPGDQDKILEAIDNYVEGGLE